MSIHFISPYRNVLFDVRRGLYGIRDPESERLRGHGGREMVEDEADVDAVGRQVHALVHLAVADVDDFAVGESPRHAEK